MQIILQIHNHGYNIEANLHPHENPLGASSRSAMKYLPGYSFLTDHQDA